MYSNINADYMGYLYDLLFAGYTMDLSQTLPMELQYADMTVLSTDYIVVPEWFPSLQEQTRTFCLENK